MVKVSDVYSCGLWKRKRKCLDLTSIVHKKIHITTFSMTWEKLAQAKNFTLLF